MYGPRNHTLLFLFDMMFPVTIRCHIRSTFVDFRKPLRSSRKSFHSLRRDLFRSGMSISSVRPPSTAIPITPFTVPKISILSLIIEALHLLFNSICRAVPVPATVPCVAVEIGWTILPEMYHFDILITNSPACFAASTDSCQVSFGLKLQPRYHSASSAPVGKRLTDTYGRSFPKYCKSCASSVHSILVMSCLNAP